MARFDSSSGQAPAVKEVGRERDAVPCPAPTSPASCCSPPGIQNHPLPPALVQRSWGREGKRDPLGGAPSLHRIPGREQRGCQSCARPHPQPTSALERRRAREAHASRGKSDFRPAEEGGGESLTYLIKQDFPVLVQKEPCRRGRERNTHHQGLRAPHTHPRFPTQPSSCCSPPPEGDQQEPPPLAGEPRETLGGAGRLGPLSGKGVELTAGRGALAGVLGQAGAASSRTSR